MTSLQSPIPWVGSKRRLRDEIIPLLPPHTCYVEPFCGSASVYFGKEPSAVEVLNDVNGNLINLFEQIRTNADAFYDRMWWLFPSRQIHKTAVDQLSYNAHNLSDLDRAVLFYYAIKNGFGSMFGKGFAFSRQRPPRSAISHEALLTIKERLSNTYIENLSFERVIKNYDSPATVFYCDPPYTMSDRSTEYTHVFNDELHTALRDKLAAIAGKFILSYDDAPKIRQLYKGFKIRQTKPITYTLNKRKKNEEKRELLIMNF